MKDTHLKDDELVALCMDAALASPVPGRHLAGCAACRHRRAALADMLDGVSHTATSEADAAFPAERRARQLVRILQRLDRHATFGRVLAFPRASAVRTPFLRPRPMRRWIAGAAAAGLFIGMLAGHLAHEFPARTPPSADPAAALVTAARAPLIAAPAVSDDEFLIEVQNAVSRSGPVAFGPLADLTPVAWEVR
jgi:hypothetical protein